MAKLVAEMTFKSMKNYFNFDEYLVKRFKKSFLSTYAYKQAKKEIDEFMKRGDLKKTANPKRFQKSLKNFNPQGMKWTKLFRVGDKFSVSELQKKGGITEQTIKKWIKLGYIELVKCTAKDTFYQKTLVWYVSQDLLRSLPDRFKKRVISKPVITAGSSFVVTKVGGIPVKTEKTMKDYLAETEAFVITGQMRNLMKTVYAATGLKRKTIVVPTADFNQDYKLITVYDRLVLQGIR